MLQEPYAKKILAFVGIAAIIALLSYSYTAITELKYVFSGPAIISVAGEGEVFAAPDIATFSFTVEARADDAISAQNEVASKMDAIRTYLSEAGVEERDIKTQYFNLSPRYEYPETTCNEFGFCPPRGEPTIIGYQVSQSVSVKVRDTEKAGEILSAIGDHGAMNVSGLSFTIDDEDSLKAEARKLAIEDAKEKAEILAENLDARLVRMTGFWEENYGYPLPYGYGGDDMRAYDKAESALSQPASLPTGENKVTVRVNISYEIR